MKKGGGSESTIIIGPSKSVLVYALHSLEHVLGLARFRVFVPKLLLLYSVITSIGQPWAFFIKNLCSATLEFIKPISDSSHRRCRVLINGMQLYFDFLKRLSIQKKEIESILLFLHGCKQSRTWRLATAIKTKLLDKSVRNFDSHRLKDGVK